MLASLAPLDLANHPVHQGRDVSDDDIFAFVDGLVRYSPAPA